MASEVEQLLKEQKEENEKQDEANAYLRLLNDQKDLLEEIALQQMITNDDYLSGISSSISKMGDLISNEVKALTASVGQFTLPDMELNTDKIGEFLNQNDAVNEAIDVALAKNEKFSEQNAKAVSAYNSKFTSKVERLFEAFIPELAGFISTERSQEIKPTDVPVALDSEKFYAENLSTTEKMLWHLKNLDDNFEEQLRIQEEATRDVGSARSLQTKDDGTEEDSGFSLDGLSSFSKIGKMMPKGLAKLGKGLGATAAVLGTVFFISDLFEGFNNEEKITEITGKSKKDLSAAEQSAASIANGISGLTFGLLPVRETFETLAPVLEALNTGIDHLFDPEIGLFGKAVDSILKLIDGDYSGAWDALADFPKKFGDKISSIINSFFGTDIDVSKEVGSIIDKRVGQVKDAVSSIGSFFGFGEEKKPEITSQTLDTVDSIVKGEALRPTPVQSVASSTDNVSSMVDVRKRASLGDKEAIKQLSSNDAFSTRFNENDDTPTTIIDRTGDRFSQSLAQPSAKSAKPVSPSVENKSVALSKERMMRQEQAQVVATKPQAPIVINNTQPQERKVVRRSSVDDLGMSIIGSNMMD